VCRSICTPRYRTLRFIEAYEPRTMSSNIHRWLRAAWGVTVETATKPSSGIERVFDTYPCRRIIWATSGEGLRFYLWSHQPGALQRRRQGRQEFPRQTFLRDFQSRPALLLRSGVAVVCMMEMGIDGYCRVSVDYPFVTPSRNQVDGHPACAPRTREAIERQCEAAVEDQILSAATPTLPLSEDRRPAPPVSKVFPSLPQGR